MKKTSKTFYECELCGYKYSTMAGAFACESRPITHNENGVKVGDTIRITYGDGIGKRAVVESISIIDKDWGHYAWERYWHTPMFIAAIEGSTCVRQILWDQYELLS